MQCALCGELIKDDNYQKMLIGEHEKRSYDIYNDCLDSFGIVDI